MKRTPIHLVAFDIPYPANYGGVIDVFYKIKALHELNCEIILHCFTYGNRSKQVELEKYCTKVYYYPRPKNILQQFSFLPFIVKSRRSKVLLNNLLLDDFPILFEGLHTTYWLSKDKFKNRKTIVRAHNIEHQYYGFLAQMETNPFKRFFFWLESVKLKRYEVVLKKATHFLSISATDQLYFQSKYGNSSLVLPFHPYTKLESKIGFGKFVLYHADLSINENDVVAKFLIEKVFSKLEIPLIIAGRNPKSDLIKLASTYSTISVIANPSIDAMNKLVSDAHINIIYSLQASGFKLKLLSSLYCGRHCVVNDTAIENTGFETVVTKANDEEHLSETIRKLMELPFNQEQFIEKEHILNNQFSNNLNAKKIKALL